MIFFLTDMFEKWSASNEFSRLSESRPSEAILLLNYLRQVDDEGIVKNTSLTQAQHIDIDIYGRENLFWWDIRGAGAFFSYDGTDVTIHLVGAVDNPPSWADLLAEVKRRGEHATLGEMADFSSLPAEISTEQRPAAYRFTLRGDRLDVLPEPPEPEDREFALDTYNELIAKATELFDRLRRSNATPRVGGSIHRLLTAIGTDFDDLRPGVLLSRVRSIEADRAAFDSAEARAELFADALAMLDDVLQSAHDLMASFPIIRHIEAERLALDLDRNPGAVPILRERMGEIKQAAEQSQAATEQAIDALAQNDNAIEEATDPVLRTSLVADKLLVVRNFIGAAASALGKAKAELGDVSEKSWAAIKAELPKGIGFVARVAPFMGLVTLIGWLAGPVTGIAAVVPGFKASPARLTSSSRPKAPVFASIRPGQAVEPDHEDRNQLALFPLLGAGEPEGEARAGFRDVLG